MSHFSNGVPATPNRAIPIRRTDILRLAQGIRGAIDPKRIDEAADTKGIILARVSGPKNREAGFACIEYLRRPRYIESLACPGELLTVWGEVTLEPVRSIVINTNSDIPECEVFWHEYYHLFYSPLTLQRSERFEHHFSTEGALHSQEERRANEFAAAVLIPSIEDCKTADEISERYDVSRRLAEKAIRFYSASARRPL